MHSFYELTLFFVVAAILSISTFPKVGPNNGHFSFALSGFYSPTESGPSGCT